MTTQSKEVIYYTIKLRLPGPASPMLAYQEHRDELFLTANGRSSGVGKEAHLDSSELAEKFLEAYIPRLAKRHGAGVKAEILVVTTRGYANRTQARVEKDSTIARKRLETGILASNQTP